MISYCNLEKNALTLYSQLKNFTAMKKKLRLQKEVVSVLDKKQMNYLTKGGNDTVIESAAATKCCPTGWTAICTEHTLTCDSFACLTKFDCESNPCIDPMTQDCGGGGTDTCVTVTGCYSDVCPISTFKCEETNGCLISDLDTNC